MVIKVFLLWSKRKNYVTSPLPPLAGCFLDTANHRRGNPAQGGRGQQGRIPALLHGYGRLCQPLEPRLAAVLSLELQREGPGRGEETLRCYPVCVCDRVM